MLLFDWFKLSPAEEISQVGILCALCLFVVIIESKYCIVSYHLLASSQHVGATVVVFFLM